jgi:Protease inhibitor Inh
MIRLISSFVVLAMATGAASAQIAQPSRTGSPPSAAPAEQAAAQPPEALLPLTSDATRIMAGQWDIAVPRNNLKCRIQLSVRGQATPTAIVGMPPPCRRSLASMGQAETWVLTDRGAIRLMNKKGEKIADFTRADQGLLKATLSGNEFTLEPVSGRYPSPERIASVDTAVARLNTPMAEQPTTPAAVAGRYQLSRANNADTGCVLNLDRTQPGSVSRSGRASLEQGCKDQGLLTFDPAGWIVERDRMFLYARKGHRFGFNIERDGRVVKDPPQGSPLSGRKL